MQRVRLEEPALEMLRNALQTKRQIDLQRAIDSAEAADAAFAAFAEEEDKARRKERKVGIR